MNIKIDVSLSSIRKLFKPNIVDMPDRRYDLDWLRILVFGLLILFHSGMFYVANWGWHAKSSYRSELLENLMLFVEPWRMAVLWFIAGMAIKFILAKVSVTRFVIMRSIRLMLPLLFGILIVVPPQLYVEMSQNGDLNISFWQFIQAFYGDNNELFANYRPGIWHHIDVNHLWFIRSLWQFSLALLCLLPLLNAKWLNNLVDKIIKQHGFISIVLAVLPIYLLQMTHDLHNSRYSIGFTFMVYGYLIGWHKHFWQKLSENIKPLIIVSFIFYGTFICFYNLFWQDVFKGHGQDNAIAMLFGMLNYNIFRLLGVLTVLALAFKYLNKNSNQLSYLNEAVYPFYILHQSIIIVIGYNLTFIDLGPIWEPILLLALTSISCFIGFEVIKRNELLRPCFGLKMTKQYHSVVQKLGYITVGLLIAPISWKVFSWGVEVIFF